jgi:hypothetical protein
MQQHTGIDDTADDAALYSRFGQAIFAHERLNTSQSLRTRSDLRP